MQTVLTQFSLILLAYYVEIIESDGVTTATAEAYDHTGEEDSGYMAVALYSYITDEISFVEGTVITNITFESDDWWQGTAPDGSVGLFPGKSNGFFPSACLCKLF